MRLLLGRYLGLDPASISLVYSAHGKPMLGLEARSSLRFNLSHSAGRAVYAISRGRELGVDIEQVRPLVDLEKLAHRFFSTRERTALMALSETDRSIAFYRCWTRKEAYLKALGDGLSRPLSDFDVSVLPGARPALLHVAWEPGGADRWILADIELEHGFVGTLAIEGPPPDDGS